MVCALAVGRAEAQDGRGSIAGRVADSSGGVLPGVAVTVVNNGTNSTATVVTNAQGQFTVPFLISGTYRVTVELSGFRTTLAKVRFMNHHLLDLGLTKNFSLGDRVRVQVRVEALNATNYTLFGVGNVQLHPTNASFMRLNNIDSSTVMKPRDIQLGARITF